ncbi:transcriptional regulator, TraR/DksA family [Marininema mesophilum]|uniref:Transcriptional regulator, TraR/DksA family n=1 Tax=Marininema mesophilum TaxID=1048340 RepID=A0A1H2QC10_9BACL|nr:TraR/DksA C4-type zinc finger protein [Marininema mesophilum]SDW04696.1 transcriptional regulator, TraR/DksA family [Marininema mesophilum]
MIAMLTEEQLAGLKSQLENEKARLQKKLSDNNHFGMEQGMNDSIGELSGYDNHPADIGTELFERGKDLALNDEHEEQLEEVEMALLRMDAHHYGTCVVCGEEIPYERLEAVPETSFCIDHQRDKDISNRRPVEEQVLQSPFGRTFNDCKDDNAFDGEDAWQAVERYGTSNPPDFFREGKDYNELTIDPEERIGYADDVEELAVAGVDGRPIESTVGIYQDAANRRKEEIDDEENPLE